MDGSVTSGEMEATDRGEAFRILGRQRLQPVSLNERGGASSKKGQATAGGEKKSGAWSFSFGKKKEETAAPAGPVRLKRGQVVLFTEELSDMLAAGLQLEQALKVMENREELSTLKIVVTNIRQQVRDGTSFSVALRNSSPSFGPLYCSMAAAGEVSGALPVILKRQAEYLNTIQELQNTVVMAMIYPAFLVLAGIGVTVLFVTFLIPQLMELINSTDGNAPAGALLLMEASDMLKTYWWVVILLIALVAVVIKVLFKDEKRLAWWHETQLKIPIVGKVLQSRFYVQSMETLANLTGNGLPLLKGIELTRDTTLNKFLRKKMEMVVAVVGEGGSLSRAMKKAGFFPSLLIDMVTVGEQTGDMETALRRAAQRYDKELGKNIERMSAMMQPMIVLVMAGLIGTMAYLMISVIFDTITQMESTR